MATTLTKTIEDLAKKYGKKVIYRGDEVFTGRKIPTGVPAYDYVTNGGILVNQNNELYGSYGSLKSWMCLKTTAQFQKYDWANNVPNAISKITYKVIKTRSKAEGTDGLAFTEIDSITPRRGYKPKTPIVAKRVAYLDIESTFDRAWAEKMGVDVEGLLYYCADSMNQAIDVAETLLRDENVCLVIIDSMSIIGSDQENESSMENDQMATNARLWNKGARKLRSAMNTNPDATLITINATSTSMGGFGDPEVLKNGKQMSLMKACSVRMNGLKLQKGKPDGVTEQNVGRMISLINKKQKFGASFRESEFYYCLVDDGVLTAGETDIPQQLITLGSKYDIIKRTGNMFMYGSLKVNGMESFKTKLRESPEVMKDLKDEIYLQINNI